MNLKVLVDARGGYREWWPLGRRLLPVQFYKFEPEELFSRSLKAALRISSDVTVLCDEWNRFLAQEIMERVGMEEPEKRCVFDAQDLKGEFLVLPSTIIEISEKDLNMLKTRACYFYRPKRPKPGTLHMSEDGKMETPKSFEKAKELMEEGWMVFSGIYYGRPDAEPTFDEVEILENFDKLDSFIDLASLQSPSGVFGDPQGIVYSEREIFVFGAKDTLILELEDTSLIASLDQLPLSEDLYKNVKREFPEKADVHKTAYRPWGSYTVLDEGENFKVKRITVKPGKRLSLQLHHHRSENWTVVRGVAKVRVGEKETLLKPGEHVFIPLGTVHRLENPGKIPLEVIEVQVGEYLGEDDIVRIEDDFKRV